jgi:prevent-host-death family protein
MEHVGVYAAKTHLASLLDRVEGGEEVLITRHGRPVARLVPVEPQDKAARTKALVDEIRSTRKGFRITGKELSALVQAGRRF